MGCRPLASQLFRYTWHQRQSWRDAGMLFLKGFKEFLRMFFALEWILVMQWLSAGACNMKSKNVHGTKLENLCQLMQSNRGLTTSCQLLGPVAPDLIESLHRIVAAAKFMHCMWVKLVQCFSISISNRSHFYFSFAVYSMVEGLKYMHSFSFRRVEEMSKMVLVPHTSVLLWYVEVFDVLNWCL